VIVDEEQHFGVAHKERLKALRADVHVLTLTATPIPRTLQMAMSGLRELSVIQTPPVDRLAIRTYVTPWDPVVMREALLREHYRGGQSFFVVPRIADLPEMEEWLREEVPEVKAVTAHGQMAASAVEERMSAFYDRKYDVLLSTSIVERARHPFSQHLDRPPRRPLRPPSSTSRAAAPPVETAPTPI
jgi:transcription-repair coupling factor (superfamily II helicase)